jgi:hypothetical protein
MTTLAGIAKRINFRNLAYHQQQQQQQQDEISGLLVPLKAKRKTRTKPRTNAGRDPFHERLGVTQRGPTHNHGEARFFDQCEDDEPLLDWSQLTRAKETMNVRRSIYNEGLGRRLYTV